MPILVNISPITMYCPFEWENAPLAFPSTAPCLSFVQNIFDASISLLRKILSANEEPLWHVSLVPGFHLAIDLEAFIKGGDITKLGLISQLSLPHLLHLLLFVNGSSSLFVMSVSMLTPKNVKVGMRHPRHAKEAKVCAFNLFEQKCEENVL